MSFKREGDDQALLHNLKMRRVGELLSDHIPDDEAKLLSNGRLTCLICCQRPIFDTFAMLANHRKGKRHIAELGKYLLHKRELEYKKLKSDHQLYIKAEEVSRKGRSGKLQGSFQRKPVLSISLPLTASQTQLKCKNIPSATSQVRHYLKELQRKRALQKTVERCRETYTIQSSSLIREPDCQQTADTTLSTNNNLSHKSTITSPNIEKDLQLRMSGWIKSPDGKWIKDPEAEFDSDEEVPVVSS